MCELGRRLQEARIAKGLEVSDVAETLKMRRFNIEAIESCQFDLLPEPALARGYVKRYAQLLGLEAEPLLALYPGSQESRPAVLRSVGAAEALVKQAEPARSSQGSSRVWLIPLVLLLAVLGWLGYTLIAPKPAAPTPSTLQPEPTPAPPPTPTPQQITLRIATQPNGARVFLDGFLLGQSPIETNVEAGQRTIRVEAQGYQKYEQSWNLDQSRNLSFALKPVAPAAASPGTTPPTDPNAATPAPPLNPNNALVIKMEGRSWIRVVNARTGAALYEGIPAPGVELSYPLPVVVRAGNAGAVRIKVNNQDRGLMGKTGEVTSQRYGQQ